MRTLVEDPSVLEPAERRGMVVSAQGRVRFRHELARRAVELSLPASRRMDHHRRVLAALAVGGAEPSRLVHHAVAAADEQAVARQRRRGGQGRRRVLGPPGGGRLRRAGPGARGAVRPPGGGRAARAGRPGPYALNQFGEAAEHADRAVELWDAAGSAPLELGEALLISARMSTLRADPGDGQGQGRCGRSPSWRRTSPARALALAYSTLGSQDTLQARFDAAVGW